MARAELISNEILLEAGLELMEVNGKPLTKLPSKGRAMIFALENGQTVRARTCNDHVLIAVADRPTEDAKLNVEGTDWILIVMPETERTHGNVIAYLVPTEEAVEAVRSTHMKWLATNPATKGANTTWNIWFDDRGPGKANGFGAKWAKYRLDGQLSTRDFAPNTPESLRDKAGDLKAEVTAARERIANIAGVHTDSVRISIDFGAG